VLFDKVVGQLEQLKLYNEEHEVFGTEARARGIETVSETVSETVPETVSETLSKATEAVSETNETIKRENSTSANSGNGAVDGDGGPRRGSSDRDRDLHEGSTADAVSPTPTEPTNETSRTVADAPGGGMPPSLTPDMGSLNASSVLL
jgi:hypothetical protein